ncbi:MAG: hypothetical protein ACRAVC_13635 [Trichormus sp.]
MTNQVLPSNLFVELSAEEQQQLAGGCCGASPIPSCGCDDSRRRGYGGFVRRRRFGGWGNHNYKYGKHSSC